MIFQYPLFLYGTIFSIIPIVIHLFAFRKYKKIYFTQVYLVSLAKKEHTSHTHLRKLLLLFLRIIFICSLSFAFAQPILLRDTNQYQLFDQRQETYIYIDNSMSMQAKENKESFFDLAKSSAIESVKSLGTEVQLISHSSGLSSRFLNFDQFLTQLYQISYSSVSEPIHIDLQRTLLGKNKNKKKTFFIFSDFQKNTFSDFLLSPQDSSVHFFFIPFANQTYNLYVDSVWFKDAFIYPKQMNTCYVQLNKSGNRAVKDQYVQFFIDNKQVASQQISMSADQKKLLLEFNFYLMDRGTFHARVSTKESTHIFDNDFYFTFQAAPDIDVIHISDNEQEAKAFKKIFATSPIFHFQDMTTQKINYQQVQKANCIIINKVKDLSFSLRNVLNNSLNNHVNILIIPDENINISDYRQWLSFPIRKVDDMSDQMFPLSIHHYPNVFFTGVFEKKPENYSMPKAKPLFSWQTGNQEKILIFEALNTPFLSRISKKKGTIFLMASDINTSSNLEFHALFLPLMYKIATFGDALNKKNAYFLNDKVISIPLDTLKSHVFQLLHRDSTQKTMFIPNQRVINNHLDLLLQADPLPDGIYALQRRDDDAILDNIALNYSRKESEMDFYSMEDLEKIAENREDISIIDPSMLVSFAQKEQDVFSIPLWKYFIVLALFCLICESLFIRFSNS